MCQAVEELLVELDVDKNSIVVGASRVRAGLEPSNRSQSVMIEIYFSLLGLRCLWREVCYNTWSSRGISRWPGGWFTYRPPVRDMSDVRSIANSRWDPVRFAAWSPSSVRFAAPELQSGLLCEAPVRFFFSFLQNMQMFLGNKCRLNRIWN